MVGVELTKRRNIKKDESRPRHLVFYIGSGFICSCVKIGHNSNTSAEPSLRAIGGEVLKAIEGWPTLLMIRPAPVGLLFSDFQPR